MSAILVIAPHPDDETLGCGGTLLRAIAEGYQVHWLIISAMSESQGFSKDRIAARHNEIQKVAFAYGFSSVEKLGFSTTLLDTVPRADLVGKIGCALKQLEPDTIYLPFRYDAHSDHAAVFDASIGCTKSFRYPSIKRVYCYETLSETEFSLMPGAPGFRPQRYVDISAYLERKIEIMQMFSGEMAAFPFPRSAEAIRAQAAMRGIVAGVSAAEAFMVLKEIV